jgi:hypothetical protein
MHTGSQAAASATRPSEVALPAGDADVLELVFRDLLQHTPPGELCFISLGTKDGAWLDAPDHFIRRLADLKLQLKKPSDARFPELGEMEPDGTRLARIRDKASGRGGAVYWVRITKRRSDAEPEIEAGRLGRGAQWRGLLGRTS